MENKLNVFDENGVPLTWTEVIDKLCSAPFAEIPNLTRVEVIEPSGRIYHNWEQSNKVSISMQDEGRTLKIFVSR